ncbi:MAG: DUF4327 family protein [Cyanobacteria bacterium J06632_22]
MLQSLNYSICTIQDEARELVFQGQISRHQPIYTLCKYIPARAWTTVESELEANGFLLRDRISDLMGREDWEND